MRELAHPLRPSAAPSRGHRWRTGEAGSAAVAWLRRFVAPLFLALCWTGVSAQEARPLAADPVLEAKVMHIAEELRCLVCQNETIAASHADLAVDLRQQIRLKLQQGQSQAQILDFMVQRYGDFVLYEPPVKGVTLLLWGGPALLLFGSAGWLVLRLRRRSSELAATAGLSATERTRARELLAGRAQPSSESPESRS